jgi:hypothetical protein
MATKSFIHVIGHPSKDPDAITVWASSQEPVLLCVDDITHADITDDIKSSIFDVLNTPEQPTRLSLHATEGSYQGIPFSFFTLEGIPDTDFKVVSHHKLADGRPVTLLIGTPIHSVSAGHRLALIKEIPCVAYRLVHTDPLVFKRYGSVACPVDDAWPHSRDPLSYRAMRCPNDPIYVDENRDDEFKRQYYAV